MSKHLSFSPCLVVALGLSDWWQTEDSSGAYVFRFQVQK